MKTIKDLVEAIGATGDEKGTFKIGRLGISQNKIGKDINFSVDGRIIMWIDKSDIVETASLSEVPIIIMSSLFEKKEIAKEEEERGIVKELKAEIEELESIRIQQAAILRTYKEIYQPEGVASISYK